MKKSFLQKILANSFLRSDSEFEKLEKFENKLQSLTELQSLLAVLAFQLDVFERELIADKERLRIFREGTLDAVKKLIEQDNYDLAETFHSRVVERFEGIVFHSIQGLEFVEFDD